MVLMTVRLTDNSDAKFSAGGSSCLVILVFLVTRQASYDNGRYDLQPQFLARAIRWTAINIVYMRAVYKHVDCARMTLCRLSVCLSPRSYIYIGGV